MDKELEVVRKLQHCGVKEYRVTLEKVEQALLELKVIKESNPSEALEEIKQIEFYVGTIIGLKFIKGNDVFSEAKKQDYEIFEKKSEKIKQYILKAQEQEQKLDRVEKLTNLPFKERRKIGQEYIKWCQKNNAVFDDATNMITWVLCIKLKEVF